MLDNQKLMVILIPIINQTPVTTRAAALRSQANADLIHLQEQAIPTPASSNKTTRKRSSKQKRKQVEIQQIMPSADSQICPPLQPQSTTLDAVLTPEALHEYPHEDLWDELAIFLGLFGSTRSDRACYDRGIMCELYNPTGVVRRQLVSRTNIMVKPRLCILAAGHPRETINCLTDLVSEVREKNVEKIIADIIALPMVPKHLVRQRHFATKPNIWLWIMSIKDFDETTTIAIEQEEHQQRQTRPRHRKNIQRDQDLFSLKQKLEKQYIDIEEYCVQLRHFSYTYMKQLDE
ncbi:unnamed protein product [Rotaria sp. Silwood1]|nr:unnamed protein product [Rotaria sp. Silwood1]